MASTQYQHYIPQFMLRRFAVVEQTSPSKVSKRNRKSEKQHRNRNATVKVLHLRRSPPKITNELVRRTFGQQDMYNDGLKDCVETKIYPPDALWLAQHVRSMYMAFVTPSDPQEEFILTENAFGIHEGPVSYSVNRFTGKKKQTVYTEFHLLTVISPRLAIVFRSEEMPEPLEDLIPRVREWKSTMLAMTAHIHADPEHVTSLLEDLPIAKARNSYTTVRNGRIELAEGADGVPKMNDKFVFIFFPLESDHAQKINMVMLDQAHDIDKLVFKSETALLKAMEFYLEYPCLTRGLYSMKTVSDDPDDPRLRFLKQMEDVASMLGSSTTAKYHVDPLWEDDEAIPLETAVAQVLATTTDTPEKDHTTLATEVLMNTLIKMKNNITVSNKPDQIQDSLLVFPDAAYGEGGDPIICTDPDQSIILALDDRCC
ncbi:hypothetical protein COCCADRAFT_88263 [Bipolaris zeicola 26-R-13]|uniref:DUF4238 domain-containing protein n=1 Tax=Cochliobolus carbonum (strain 26-R-13) TaxID=930089 RepID=W6YFE1_COCC2|nr:uncharacterized protein COCCADRAFT_88263 [Bipolaris zeicola 26-R-13]EUC36400.1 hypothetical protein COCCADRAFT_88263 [Bipolaris zeicola 26-R-13]